MKADIPDKILINRGEDGRIHHSYWTTDQQLVPFEDTMYIRKDALLEWLNEARAVPHNNAIARDLAFQEVINKLNSL